MTSEIPDDSDDQQGHQQAPYGHGYARRVEERKVQKRLYVDPSFAHLEPEDLEPTGSTQGDSRRV